MKSTNTDVSQEIMHSMRDYLDKTDPAPRYFGGVAADIASVANELDRARSPLVSQVDAVLSEFVNTIGSK